MRLEFFGEWAEIQEEMAEMMPRPSDTLARQLQQVRGELAVANSRIEPLETALVEAGGQAIKLKARIAELEGHLAHATGTRELEAKPAVQIAAKPPAKPSASERKADLMRAIKYPDPAPPDKLLAGIWRMRANQYQALLHSRPEAVVKLFEDGGFCDTVMAGTDDAGWLEYVVKVIEEIKL